MIPTRPTLHTSCLGFWLTNRKDHPPAPWLLIHHWPYLFATNIIERNCTCKAIPLKREVGYKNVSLFGKLSRFSWNYGGLCSNFAPNSLSIDGRYGYVATQRKTRPEFSFVKESRNQDEDIGPVSISITLAPHKHPPPLPDKREAVIIIGWWFEWKGGALKSLCIYLTCDMFAVSWSVSDYSFIQK